MSPSTRLFIVHANRLFRECLSLALSDAKPCEVIGVDQSGLDSLESLDPKPPHVVLIDLDLPEPGAAEATRRVRRHFPEARIILLVAADVQENLLECLDAGAHGCVLDESSLEELQTALEKVAGGEVFCSSPIAFSVFNRLAQTVRISPRHQSAKPADLTSRELEIVHLVADGLSNKEIAARLDVSVYTIKNHVHNIVQKLQVADRLEAVDYARRQHWLRMPSGTRWSNGSS